MLPKVGVSYAISEEKFFERYLKYVNTLRLRASWGTTGRSPNPGDALHTLVATPFNIAGTTFAGAVPGNPGNANLKPERGVEYEAGLDAGFFGDRVSAELTYFNKQTNDLIIAKPIPPSLGFNANPLANIGSVVNRGFELALNVNALRMRDVQWDVRLSANTLHNELTSLGAIQPFTLGPAGRALVGQQLGVFVSKKIDSISVANSKVYVRDTLTPMGNILPTLEWNLTNTVTLFKNFRFAALLDSKRDFLVQNFTAYFRETQLIRSNLRLDPTALSPYERLRRFGDLTNPSKPFITASGKAATVSDVIDAYLEPGDFVRLREVSASYTLPTSWVKGMRSIVQGATITLAMQNVHLWTNYSGADPEVISNAAGIGGPKLCTASTRASFSCATDTRTGSPLAPCAIALLTRLPTALCSSTSLPAICALPTSPNSIVCRPADSARASASTCFRIASTRNHLSAVGRGLPSSRARVSRSETRWPMRSACCVISVITRFCSTSVSGRLRIVSRKPDSTVRGVRISCETLATKSRRIASARSRSVMSCESTSLESVP